MAAGYQPPEDPDRPWLIGMWVDPAWRGRGVGGSLVGSVIAWARARGASRLRLEVAQANRAAIRLYERCGFVATGETVSMERDPSIVENLMVLELGNAP